MKVKDARWLNKPKRWAAGRHGWDGSLQPFSTHAGGCRGTGPLALTAWLKESGQRKNGQPSNTTQAATIPAEGTTPPKPLLLPALSHSITPSHGIVPSPTTAVPTGPRAGGQGRCTAVRAAQGESGGSWQLCLLLSASPSRYLSVTFVLGQLSG